MPWPSLSLLDMNCNSCPGNITMLLMFDPRFILSVLELGFQTISGKVITGQERTNWEQLLSNETITPNKCENTGFLVRKEFLNRLTSKKNITVNHNSNLPWVSVTTNTAIYLSTCNNMFAYLLSGIIINISLVYILFLR